jgi:hypothetical protein
MALTLNAISLICNRLNLISPIFCSVIIVTTKLTGALVFGEFKIDHFEDSLIFFENNTVRFENKFSSNKGKQLINRRR